MYLVITTTIRAHSAIIPPAHTYSAARGKENIVTQWFELLIGHHHHQAHHRGIYIGTIITPMAWPSRPSRLQGHRAGTTVEWYRLISPIKCSVSRVRAAVARCCRANLAAPSKLENRRVAAARSYCGNASETMWMAILTFATKVIECVKPPIGWPYAFEIRTTRAWVE